MITLTGQILDCLIDFKFSEMSNEIFSSHKEILLDRAK